MTRLLSCFFLATGLFFGQNAALPPWPKVVINDTAGRPLAGGRVYTYDAGTTNPAVTYTDSTAAVPNANPIILDAAGRASLWLGAQAYKIVVQNSLGVTQWTVDNVADLGMLLRRDLADQNYGAKLVAFDPYDHAAGRTVADLADPVYGDSLVMTKQPGSAWEVPRTVREKLGDSFNVKDFGAVCNGIADDTTILTAIAALSNVTAHFPPGTCRATANVDFPATVALAFDSGAKLQVDGAAIVTIAGSVDSGNYQLFTGAGTVTLTGNGALNPIWYGMKCNNSTDDVAAAAKISVTGTRTVHIPQGTCVFGSDVSLPATTGVAFDPGSMLKMNAPGTLTIAGPILAGDYQIFDGTGAFVLTASGKVNAAWFPGADIGVKTNAAFASSCPGPCRVALPTGQTFSYANTIVTPAKHFDLDLGGAMLTYTGIGDGILVVNSNIDYMYITGRVHDGDIRGTPAGASGIHQQSRIGMVYDNVRIGHFTGGSCMWWENTTAAGPGTVQFNEQNEIQKADFEDCAKGLRWTVNGGTNSFAYNTLSDIHFGVGSAQIGFIMEGTGAPQSLFANGGFYHLRFNLDTPVAGIAISMLDGADWERATVVINGEQTSGAAASWGLVMNANTTFNNFGTMQIDGAAAPLANSLGGWRAILQPRGFPDTVAPINEYVSDFAGSVRFRNDQVYGVTGVPTHWTFPDADSDTSFKLVIGIGDTSATKTFTKPFGVIPNCTASPNTDLLGPGGIGIGMFHLNPWAINKLDVVMSAAQGTIITFFVHCMGNPN